MTMNKFFFVIVLFLCNLVGASDKSVSIDSTIHSPSSVVATEGFGTITERFQSFNNQIANADFHVIDGDRSIGIQGIHLLRTIRRDVIDAELRAYFITVDQDNFDIIFHKACPVQQQFMLQCRYQQFKK